MRKLRRNGSWLKFCCGVLILLGTSNARIQQTWAGEDKTQRSDTKNQGSENSTDTHIDRSSSTAYTATSFLSDAWKLPVIIVDETVEIARDKDYVPLLLLAGGGSIALHADGVDDKIADNFDKPSLNGEVDKITDLLGGPGIHFAATGLWYLIAEDNGDLAGKEHAWTMLKALSVTGATTLGLKMIRNNETPNGKPLAWPSGHTSSSFTVAAVLDELYGPEVGIPAYLGAGFVGYRMMDSGDHWASDVLFGAVLGYIVGHHIAGKHIELELGGFEVVPYTSTLYDENVLGISLVKNF